MSHTSITTDNTVWDLTVTTQMVRENEIEDLTNWERITNSESSSIPLPADRSPLRTLRVTEDCPRHEKMNADFNNGNCTSFFSTDERQAQKTGYRHSHKYASTVEEIIGVLRYVVADGRFGVRLTIRDRVSTPGTIASMGLPKSVGKWQTQQVGVANGKRDEWGECYDFHRVECLRVEYKVNGSTGERNETGEKRVNRVLKALDL